jgi:hypothetical protein
MTNWTETYRGAVPPWQCDVTEHFTVGYYFDRLEEADANLGDVFGLGDVGRRGDAPRRIDARFAANCGPGRAFMSRARHSGLAAKGAIAGCGWAIASSIRPMARW